MSPDRISDHAQGLFDRVSLGDTTWQRCTFHNIAAVFKVWLEFHRVVLTPHHNFVGPPRAQCRHLPPDLFYDLVQRQAENKLPVSEGINHHLGVFGQNKDALPIGQKPELGKRLLGRGGMFLQVREAFANLLKANALLAQHPRDPELHEVHEGIETDRACSSSLLKRRLDKVGTIPIVKLSIT